VLVPTVTVTTTISNRQREIDQRTGMIVDLGALNQVTDMVVEPFDHTFLNKDIPYFAKVIPTAENIAVHIRNLLQQPIRELGASCTKSS